MEGIETDGIVLNALVGLGARTRRSVFRGCDA